MLGNEMFKFPEGVVSRWASYENPDGAKGAGGKERNGRKGAAWFTLNPGEEFVLAHAENTSGVIRRIWITINDQTPETLRGLKLEMFWDGCDKPAVSVPFGDFFCVGLGKVATFKNALFSNPEGRNFSTYIPMPFKTGMKITVTNESSVLIKHFYYDIDYTLGDKFTEDTLYFHAYFNRENLTNLKKDFELLPYVEGKGRYLGTNMGVRCNTKLYSDTWWGEGEFKAYDVFMAAMEQDKYKNMLNEQEKLTLEYLSKTVLSGVRPDELVILRQLLHRDHIEVEDFIKEYKNTYGIEISTSRVKKAIQVLQGHFVSKEAEYQKYCQIDILENDPAGMIKRLQSYTERLTHIPFYTQVEDIIKVGIARYKEKYLPGIKSEDPFVLYEKYSRRDVSLLMNCGKDLSSIMYGMKRIENDVFIFITYHKEESQDEKNYVDGKPDYADTFEDNLIFKWDSQIGKGLDSSYMKDVLGADRKHLFVKKSDAETSFYYMGQFDVLEARNAQKEDNRGRMQPITKVTMKMHHAVREDLLRYLQSHITA